MHHWVLRFNDNELLEVHKSQTSVTDQVSALSSVQVSIKQVLVEVDGDRQICDCLLEHT